MINFFQKIIVTGLIALTSFFGGHQNQTPVQGSFTPVEGTQFTVSQTVLPTDTTITLTSFTTPDGRLLTMSNFGTIGYLTLDPTNVSRLETVTFTGITQNATNAVLTGVTRGIDFIYPYAPTLSLERTHLVGSVAILSNPAAFYGQQFLLANQSGTSTASIVFSSTTPPTYDIEPSNIMWNAYPGTALVDLNKLNATAIAGAANSTESVNGISQLATQLQMASSSSTGSTGANLTLQSKYATSSAGSIGLFIPITRNDGKLSPQFIATTSTDTYNFGGQVTFLASTTLQATTTIAASSVTNNALNLNGLNYKFPSTRAASSTALMENGSGSLTFELVRQEPISVLDTNDITVTSGAYATSTLSITIPANTLTASSTIQVSFVMTGACLESNSSGSCQLALRTATGKPLLDFSTIGTDTTSDTGGQATGMFVVNSNNSGSNFQSQNVLGWSNQNYAGTSIGGKTFEIAGTGAIDFTQTQTLYLVAHGSTSSTSFTIGNWSIIVNP